MSFTAQITADIGGFEASLNKAGERLKQFQKDVDDGIAGISHIGKSIEGLGKKLSVVSAALVVAGGAAFKMAADLQDAIGATDQIFKGASDSVKNWADGLKSDYGVAKKEALEYSNLMGTMLKEIGGLTRDEAAKQASSLVELAGDLTAMFGGNVSEAVTALTGSLRGVNVMLGRYGVAVNDVLIKTRAFEMGILSAGQEMTPAIKQAATLSLIYEQTRDAQGQAAREAKSASGSMRSLRVEITNLSTEIGEKLLPVITPIVVKIRDIVSVIRSMSPEMLSLSVAVAGIAAAAGPILVIVGSVVKMLPVMKVGIASIKTAMIALTGPVAAITLALAALTAGIVYFANRAKEAVTVSGALSNVNKKVEASIRSEKAELNMLLAIATDETKSKENRLEAIRKINAISPEYLGSITLETVKTNEAKRAVDNYTTAIGKNARQKAISEKIVQLYSKQLEYEEKIARETQKIEEDKAKGFINSNIILQSAFKLRRSEFQNELENVNASIKIYESLSDQYVETGKAGTGAADEIIQKNLNVHDLIKQTNNKIGETKARLEGLRSGAIAVDDVKAEIEKTDEELAGFIKTLEVLTGKSKSSKDAVKEIFKDGDNIFTVVRQVSDSITVLTQRLEGVRSGKIGVENVAAEIERLEKEINELNTALNQLTGDRKLNIKMQVDSSMKSWMETDMFKDIKPVITPKIDPSLLKNAMGDLSEEIQGTSMELTNMIISATTSLMDAAATAIVNDENVMKALTVSLLGTLGNALVQLGEMAIGVGIGVLGIKKALESLNPVIAIAAGAALIALGSYASARSKKIAGSLGGRSSGYTGGTSSYNNITSPGVSEYRGQWEDNFNVVFHIGQNELVGTLDMAQQRRRRT